MKLDLQAIKEKLEREKTELERSLSEIGQRNPEDKNDWQVTPPPGRDQVESRDEVADWLEEVDEREEAEISLEKRLENVKAALQRLANGNYGVCLVGGEPIEPERLLANPAANTCKKHREAN